MADGDLRGTAGRRRTTVRVRGVEDTGPFPGRHASRTEIAAETPIFHALTVGGWRGRQHEPSAARRAASAAPGRRSAEALDEFRRDPLTAPIPVQAYTAPTPTPAPAPVAGGGGYAPLYSAHVPSYAPAATGAAASGRHHRGAGSGHHHLSV